ncbi:hypothetical protein [Lactococcus lactis]|uniref:Serotype determinant, transmembrane protein n=1 Tax=Lactococcus lactis TaxID=1358 RepID=A0AAP3YZU4_9LACT|nr:hypothetical protein [Lactococcus lactis]MCC4120874.1 hypothetical protein [Lactococcus lactis]MDG4968863.1 hypothetical protein [Lactococcus lactis]MDG4975760.1 hypothetical protein [Lactococcus lactis]MDG5102958.1 hypothetical protein [Lactococcus lactis]WDA68730.1 hypothetical protein IL310_14600 [Lactococcus lactis]
MSRDALWFSKVNSSPLAFAIKRYETWSSRFWIEGAVLVASKHLFIFFLITIISVFFLFYSVSKLISFNKFISNLVLVLFFIALFPIASLQSAGFIATIVNYIWPSALFAYWLMIDNQRKSETVASYKVIISTFCLILSVFNEGLAIMLFLYLIIRLVIEKKEFLNIYRMICLLVSFLSILNVLFCPGNQKRGISEMTHWFPTFDHLSFWDKLLIQLDNIASNLIVNHNLMGIFLLLLLARAVQKRQSLSIILSGLAIMLSKISESLISKPLDTIVKHSSGKEFNYNITSMLLAPSLIFIIILGLVVFIIILLYGKSSKSLIAITSLGTTFATGMSLSLSPTLLASEDRPLLFLYFVIIFNCVVLLDDMIEFNKNKDKIVVKKISE